MSLENAPKHIQLAVDMIQIFEDNNIDTKTVLDALEIVNQDYQRKQKEAQIQQTDQLTQLA